MNAAVFWRGVALAVALSLSAIAAMFVFAPLFGTGNALRLIVLAVTSACLLDQLLRPGPIAGRVVSLAGWTLLAAGLLLINPPLVMWLVLPAAALWLQRCLVTDQGVLRALLDGAISLVAVGVAWAALRHSGSIAVALWCWLLLQALAQSLTSSRPIAMPADRFSTAQRSAEAALRQLSTSRC